MLGRETSLGTNTFNVSAVMFHRKQDFMRLLTQNKICMIYILTAQNCSCNFGL